MMNCYISLLGFNTGLFDNTSCWVKKLDVEKLRGYFSVPHIVVGLGF